MLNSAVFASCKANGMKNDTAWRITCAWSPAVIFVLGVLVFFFTDDSPYGNFKELKRRKEASAAAKADAEAAELEALKTGGEPGSIAAKSLLEAASSWQTWILHLCYMFSFGVELIVNGNIVSYFVTTFGMTQGEAGMIGSIFGFLNIFARSLGGFMSDRLNTRMGPTGRLWALFIQTLLMGTALISFSSLTRDDTRGVKAWHALSAHYDGLPFHVSAPSSQSSSSCGSSSSGRSVSSGRSSASSSPPDPVVSRDSVRGESRVALFQPRRAAWDSEIEPEEKLFCRREPQNRAAHGRGRAPPRIDVMGAS